MTPRLAGGIVHRRLVPPTLLALGRISSHSVSFDGTDASSRVVATPVSKGYRTPGGQWAQAAGGLERASTNHPNISRPSAMGHDCGHLVPQSHFRALRRGPNRGEDVSPTHVELMPNEPAYAFSVAGGWPCPPCLPFIRRSGPRPNCKSPMVASISILREVSAALATRGCSPGNGCASGCRRSPRPARAHRVRGTSRRADSVRAYAGRRRGVGWR